MPPSKKSFGVVYKIINHTRKIEYVIFKEGAHFKKNQNALATKSNCDVYKIVCHLCKSQKPHAKNPGPPFRRPAPLGLGLGCADPPSWTGRSQRVVHFWSKCKFDLRKNFSGAKYLQTSGGHNFFILDRHDLKLHQSTQLTVLRRSRIRKGPQTA